MVTVQAPPEVLCNMAWILPAAVEEAIPVYTTCPKLLGMTPVAVVEAVSQTMSPAACPVGACVVQATVPVEVAAIVWLSAIGPKSQKPLNIEVTLVPFVPTFKPPDTYSAVEVADVELEVSMFKLVIVEVELLASIPPVRVERPVTESVLSSVAAFDTLRAEVEA